jgi:hypothetical protein
LTGPGTLTPSLPEAFPAPLQVLLPGAGQPGGPGGPGGAPAPGLGSGYEINIRAAPDYSVLAAVLPRYESLQFTKMLDDKGSGSSVSNLDDPWFASASILLGTPSSPYVIAQGSSDADADVYEAGIQLYSPQGSALTVITSTSAASGNPCTEVTDTQGNIYFCVPCNLLSSNPFTAGGLSTGWTAYQGTIAPISLPGPAGLSAPGSLSDSSAMGGSPFGWGLLFTSNGTAGGAVEGSPAPFAVTASAYYLITALVWSPAACSVAIGTDWQNGSHGYVSTSTVNVSVPAQAWTPVSAVVQAPSSGVSFAYVRCGITGTPASGQQLAVTALAGQPAGPYQVWQCLDASALGLTDAVSATYETAAANQVNLIVVSSPNVVTQDALDVVAGASGTSSAPAVSGTPSQTGELGLLVINDAAAGGPPSKPSGWTQLAQEAGSGRGLSQKLLIGLYDWPGPPIPSFWSDAIDAAPATGIIIANVDSGPGAGQEANFAAVFSLAEAAGITLTGYVPTQYGAASQGSLQALIQQWKDYYGITSIFFDEVNPAADYVSYYQELVEYVHAQPGGGAATVVLNPGSPPAQALFGVLGANDIIMVCEDSYANIAADGAAAPAWLADYPSSQIAVTVNTCPTSGDMTTALGIAASDFHAGWVWVTADNIYAAEPGYFAAEVSAVTGTGTAEQWTTVFFQDVNAAVALSPSSTITSAAWSAQLLTLACTTSAPASELWDGEHLWQVLLDGVVVFEFFAETITEQLTDTSEQRTVTTTGPGTIAALGWAAAMPPGFPDIVFKCDAIQDGFAEIDENGNLEVDTSLWNVISPTDMVTLNPSGTLQLTASPTTTYCGATPYDLTESLISAQVTPLGAGAANSTDTTVALDGSQVSQFYVQSNADPAQYLLMGVTAAGIYAQLGDPAGNQTKSLGVYNAQTQLYWQISAAYTDDTSGAIEVTFWTSADGQTWTPVWVVTPSWVPDNLTVFFACSYDEANSQVMSITNLNGNVVTPSSSGNIYFGEPIMAVWSSLLQAAQARGTIPFVTTLLDGETDSFGNPWTDSESVQIQNGTDLYSLLQSHTAIVDADYIMQPGFVLEVGLPEAGQITLGTDRSQQVIFREGSWVQQKQYTRDRSQIANLDGAVNSDGTTISASDEASIAQWGQREGWVQTAVQVDPTSMLIAAQASVEQTADEVESFTIQVAADQPGCAAFKDYNTGDWIGLEAPGPLPGGPDFSFGVNAVRVTAIAVSVDATGLVTVQLTLMTYLAWLQEQLQYIVNKMGGQFINSLGTTPVTSSAGGVPTQLPTIFAPSMGALTGIGATGVTHGAQLVYNSVTGQWQAAQTSDPDTGGAVNPTGANLQTLHYSTDTPQPSSLIASISPVGGTDQTGMNTFLPGIVSYGSDATQTIQLYMGTVSIGQSPGTQIVLNPSAQQVFNITSAIAGTLEAVSEFTTNDINEVLPGIAGSLTLGSGAAEKMAVALTSPLNANSAACVVLETENDGGTDDPVITFGQVMTPDDSSFVFTPTATLTPWAFVLYGGESGITVTDLPTGSGNWTPPADVIAVKTECWATGCGGGGSSHTYWKSIQGGGGGGAGYSQEPALAVTPGTPCAYVNPGSVSGGTGNSNGSNGQNATFAGTSVTVTAYAGTGGLSAANGGGNGTAGTSSSNTVSYPGGNGSGGGTFDGGGGGGSAGAGGSAGNGAITGGGSPGAGGGAIGGAGATSTSGHGQTGGPPGGGGGGAAGTSASGNQTGGAGAAARIRLTYAPSGSAPLISFSVAAEAGTDQFGSSWPAGTILPGPGDTNEYNSGPLLLEAAGQSVTSTTPAVVTGCEAPVAGVAYQVDGLISLTMGGTATQPRFEFTGPAASKVDVSYMMWQESLGGESVFAGHISALGTLSTAPTGSFAGGSVVQLWFRGTITFTAAGTLALEIAETTSGDTFTVNAGTVLALTPAIAVAG